MLREVLRLLGVDLDQKLAEIRAQIEEFRIKTTHQITAQLKATSLMVACVLVGTITAIATFIIVLVALYRWVEMYKGPFAALAAIGGVMALLTAVMFGLAFGRRSPRPPSAVVDRPQTGLPPRPPPPPQPVPAALSALLPSPPPNASMFDVLAHRFSTRVAAAGDEAVDAAVSIMRTGSRSTIFGTLAVAALVGVLLGRHR